MSDDPLVIVSSDCHGSLPSRLYGPYIEPKYMDRYDEWVQRQSARSRIEAQLGARRASRSARGEDMYSNFERRRRYSACESPELRVAEDEADGVVAEVIFPDFMADNTPPFTGGGAGLNNGMPFGPELFWAGQRAHNRWMADFLIPDRIAALVHISYYDIDAAVHEIMWAAERGFKGVLLPEGVSDAYPPIYTKYFARLWSAIEETGLVVSYHGGVGHREPEISRNYELITQLEGAWLSHRPLRWLIWGGVLERRPRLKVAFIEQGAEWVPAALAQMDALLDENPLGRSGAGLLSLKPSEYWRRQCFVGASQMSLAEVEMRHEIGVETILWGTDSPHADSTWGKSVAYLQATFGAAGVTEAEARLMLGENAARAYNLELEVLRDAAKRCGPTYADITAPASPHDLPGVLRARKGRSATESINFGPVAVV